MIDPGLNIAGSVELRVFQLIRLLEECTGDRLSISVTKLPKSKQFRQDAWAIRQPAGAIMVFSKWSLLRLQQRTLDILRWKGAFTCIDYVDIDLRIAADLNPDVHVAASLTAARSLERLTSGRIETGGKVMLLHHNLDERMSAPASCPTDRLRPVYFGALENTVQTERIAETVTFLRADRADEVSQLFHQLEQFNLHYCVRTPNLTTEVIAKPFTKGFVASQFGVPVLIDRSVDDAQLLLGEDYPYLIPDTSEESILTGLRNIDLTFGGPAWLDAKERVLSLQNYCSRRAISRQFMDIVSYLT
ncbi:hypothetical protein [Ruegeria hyattellae]|uniref:hypothetical protein n=1 Tax=Ruegeria hyattellae TaxID=3233337 RepID=UPI00355B1940